MTLWGAQRYLDEDADSGFACAILAARANAPLALLLGNWQANKPGHRSDVLSIVLVWAVTMNACARRLRRLPSYKLNMNLYVCDQVLRTQSSCLSARMETQSSSI